MPFEHFGASRQMPASADPGDHQRGRRIGEIGENFERGSAGVNRNIGRILELLRHPRAGRFGNDLRCPFKRAFHALFLWREIKAGAIGKHQTAALDAHALRHDQHQLIAFYRCNHGKADAGIAARRLDNRAPGQQGAACFGSFHHGKRNTVLDRSAGIGPLALHPDLMIGKQLGEADMRRVADRLEDVVELHLSSSLGIAIRFIV